MVARWHSRSVPVEAARFAREVVAQAAPANKDRAKAWLFAASRLAGFAVMAGLELGPEVVFCPPVIERFIVASERAVSAPTRRTLRTNCRAMGRALAAYPEPAPVPLPRERAKKPYTVEEISAYLALADAQPTPARRTRAGAVICLGAGAGLVGADLAQVRGTDVVARSGGVVVDVGGRRPRAVPVLLPGAAYEEGRTGLPAGDGVDGEARLAPGRPCGTGMFLREKAMADGGRGGPDVHFAGEG